MAAARSSKNQWRAFLFTLVEEGDIDVLSPRDAMTQLTKQFGADVHGGDRVWIKQTLGSYQQGRGGGRGRYGRMHCLPGGPRPQTRRLCSAFRPLQRGGPVLTSQPPTRQGGKMAQRHRLVTFGAPGYPVGQRRPEHAGRICFLHCEPRFCAFCRNCPSWIISQ